jgi:methylphosphotriester-DNA--protein-cysteine methyltransferase
MKKATLVIAILMLLGFVLSSCAVFAADTPAKTTMPWPADTKFVAVKADKTKMYHSVTDPMCSKKLATMKKEDLVFFKTKEEAEKAGYKLCAMEGKMKEKPAAAMPWPADTKFVALKADKTKMYHSVTDPDCSKKLGTMKKEDLVFFKTKEEAEKAGYKLCPAEVKVKK